eukprot:752824-Hanusia_phi.AAC.1
MHNILLISIAWHSSPLQGFMYSAGPSLQSAPRPGNRASAAGTEARHVVLARPPAPVTAEAARPEVGTSERSAAGLKLRPLPSW